MQCDPPESEPKAPRLATRRDRMALSSAISPWTTVRCRDQTDMKPMNLTLGLGLGISGWMRAVKVNHGQGAECDTQSGFAVTTGSNQDASDDERNAF